MFTHQYVSRYHRSTGGYMVIHQTPKIKSEIQGGSESAIYGLKRRTQLRANPV